MLLIPWESNRWQPKQVRQVEVENKLNLLRGASASIKAEATLHWVP
jgi:hypothetical protein